METEQLSEQVIVARLKAAIRDGAIEDIARYRTLQQCLPLQRLGQFLKEAEARVERWSAPLEQAREAWHKDLAEVDRQQKQFGDSFLLNTFDKHGNTVDTRFPGDTRKETARSASYYNERVGKLQAGQERAVGQVSRIHDIINKIAWDPAAQSAHEMIRTFHDLWEEGENADRHFRTLVSPTVSAVPFSMISVAPVTLSGAA